MNNKIKAIEYLQNNVNPKDVITIVRDTDSLAITGVMAVNSDTSKNITQEVYTAIQATNYVMNTLEFITEISVFMPCSEYRLLNYKTR